MFNILKAFKNTSYSSLDIHLHFQQFDCFKEYTLPMYLKKTEEKNIAEPYSEKLPKRPQSKNWFGWSGVYRISNICHTFLSNYIDF